MDFKDYYATLGIKSDATQDEVKRAYRKLARKFHPDVSKEPNAETRFKELAEAHEALIDVERRAAYDEMAQRHAQGQPFEPPPGWGSGYEHHQRGPSDMPGRHPRQGAHEGIDPYPAGGFSDFFETLFGGGEPPGMPHRRTGSRPSKGADQHANVSITLLDAYQGAQRVISLRVPVVDAHGRATLHERTLDVQIPKGVRAGQQLRLAGQGAAGQGGAPPGDLYLEIALLAHPTFRVEGSDIAFDLPVTPWEAALGATVTAPTPGGHVQLMVPPGSVAGRKLRLKGKGMPGKLPGDLYAVLTIALPPSGTAAEKAAYSAFAHNFASFQPRAAMAG